MHRSQVPDMSMVFHLCARADARKIYCGSWIPSCIYVCLVRLCQVSARKSCGYHQPISYFELFLAELDSFMEYIAWFFKLHGRILAYVSFLSAKQFVNNDIGRVVIPLKIYSFLYEILRSRRILACLDFFLRRCHIIGSECRTYISKGCF